ncbi:AMP-binding protein [Ruminiclostridium cellobioparum]|uniref:Long-chain acyl-CoA synthetases (AMP-forming) n=1 Tax=Ruminiclostridium cellobioparum subsp. termitidis CT1112 TaxID=1195236 RepID=S0FK42_RUMCE|nr:AMP-binding protein [Ruminiclostridium cellobioparum]EMS69524.1 Long-chain acyl-CoA synthetases (AMP-forming) [Ruminiclostridium cellobioparum subsp. termitidis CT1112]
MRAEPIYQLRKVKDLKDMMVQSTNLFGSRNAFLIKGKNGEYYAKTYIELKNDIDALGTALIDMGLKDKKIAILSQNRAEWCTTYLTVTGGVGVVVPLDRELPYNEVENLTSRAGVDAIVFSSKHRSDMLKLSRTSDIKYFIDMDLDADDDNNFLSLPKLIEKGESLLANGDKSYLDAEIDENKMAALIFTSGTTDLAKGVMLSSKNIVSDVISVCSMLYLDETDSGLSILPLHHTYECTANFLVMMYNGCCFSFNEGLKYIVQNLQETRPTILMLVPLILENMHKKIIKQASKNLLSKIKLNVALEISNFLYYFLKIDIRKKIFKQVHNIFGGRVRLVISGAAAINPDVSNDLCAMGVRIVQGYGLTECAPIVSVNNDRGFRHDSAGKALAGIDIEVEDIGEDGIGEFVVTGDNVMLGYYENPAATSKVLKNGRLYTGDLGYIDEEGYIYITGRKKNVIVTKNGKNIFPEEVEAYLAKCPYVKESLVWGRFDEESGETEVNAQVVVDIDEIKEKLRLNIISNDEVYKLIQAEIKEINKQMPMYKRIKDFTIREEEFAKTTTKKIKRYVENIG